MPRDRARIAIIPGLLRSSCNLLWVRLWILGCATPAVLAGTELPLGITHALAQSTTSAPGAGPSSPTPAASASGWSDVGLWSAFGLLVIAAILVVWFIGPRRRP